MGATSLSPTSPDYDPSTGIKLTGTGETGETTAQLNALYAQAAAENAKAQATQKPVTGVDYQTLSGYLTSGDYADAWKYASSFGGAAPSYSVIQTAKGYSVQETQPQANQAISALTNNQDLQALAPGVDWSAADVNNFYAAAQPYFNSATLGQDHSAGNDITYGDAAKLTQDATADFSTDGGAPDLSRFAGASQANAIDNYGPAIINALGSAVLTAGIGSVVAPALAGAAASGGAAATPGALGAAVGSGGALTPLGGAIAGAGSGVVSTTAGDVLNQAPLTLESVGKGALTGAVAGAVSTAAKPVTSALTSAGLPAPVSAGLVKTGTGAVAGAVSGISSGAGAGAGAEGGALNSASGAVTGSIFNAGSRIFDSGNAALPTTNTNLTNPVAPSTTMSDDSDIQPIDPTGQYATDNGDGTASGGGSGNITAADIAALLSGATTGSNSLGSEAAGDVGSMANPGNGALPIQGGGTALNGSISLGGAAGGANSPLLSQLSALLTGGSGSASTSLLASLLGLGSTAAGGALSSDAAKAAAGNFANATQFSPYSVTTANGTNSFNGTNATSTLSPDAQATSDSLNGLVQGSANNLAAGTGALQTQDYNELQASQADANNKFYQNNLDNQFANGVLSSTAGQYQSQAALDAINKQQTNDQLTAQTMAGTTQQQQLAQLTAGLNGTNQLNSSQLAGIQTGASTGSAASGANSTAQQPVLAANSNSNIGNLLTNLGGATTNSGQANSNALANYLATLG